MTTTITATIGMTAGTVTPDMFIDRLISAGRDGDDELTSATRWTVRSGVSNSDLSIEKIVDGRPAERYSMCRTIFIAAVQEWAEQALRHIEDTPDHWLRNALAVTAGSWGSVDVDADDWLSLVTCYIAENHGDQDGE